MHDIHSTSLISPVHRLPWSSLAKLCLSLGSHRLPHILECLSEIYLRCSVGGIGHALAHEFHARGLRVFATARTAEAVQDLAGTGIETLSLDVTSEKSIVMCKEEVVERTGGRLDYLVNNAGRSKRKPQRERIFHATSC